MNKLSNQVYQQQLNPWCIIRHLPKMQRVVVGRFRSWSDAEGHVRVLESLVPDASYSVIFDPPMVLQTSEERLNKQEVND